MTRLSLAVVFGLVLAGWPRAAAAATKWNVTLTASATSVPVGTTVTFRATASADPSKLERGELEVSDIFINMNSGEPVEMAPASLGRCEGEWTNHTPATFQFIAEVWTGSKRVATSAPVTVTWTSQTGPSERSEKFFDQTPPVPTPTPAPETPALRDQGPRKDFMPPRTAVLGNITGEVEISTGGGPFRPAKPGDVLRKGDFIRTSYGAEVRLKFPGSTVYVPQITQLRIDEFLDEGNIKKTQLYLRVGAVQAKVEHNASIRGGLGVTTPTCTAAARDSAMIVAYDSKTQRTAVYATEDKCYVKGKSDAAEIVVPQGFQVSVDSSGKAGRPIAYDATKLPGVLRGPSAPAPPPAPTSNRFVPQPGITPETALQQAGFKVRSATGALSIAEAGGNIVLGHGHTAVLMIAGDPITSLVLDLARPARKIFLERVGTRNGASIPTWRIEALDKSGRVLDSVGEEHGLPADARMVELHGAGITAVRLSTDNRLGTGKWATWSCLPISELSWEE